MENKTFQECLAMAKEDGFNGFSNLDSGSICFSDIEKINDELFDGGWMYRGDYLEPNIAKIEYGKVVGYFPLHTQQTTIESFFVRHAIPYIPKEA